ncbi:hypothetical protein, partial [Sphaerisporangium corydalis]
MNPQVGGSVDPVAAWSRRIAERVTPAEAASAGRIGAAYVAGGRRRRDLLRAAGAEPGGFGGVVGPGELPIVLDGLRHITENLLDLVSAHPLVDLLALLAMRRLGATPSDDQADTPAAPGTPPPATTTGPVTHGAVPQGTDGEAVLGRAAAAFGDRLRAQGIDAGRARELTYDTLELVFQHDRGTPEIEAFLHALAASPPTGRASRPHDERVAGGRAHYERVTDRPVTDGHGGGVTAGQVSGEAVEGGPGGAVEGGP